MSHLGLGGTLAEVDRDVGAFLSEADVGCLADARAAASDQHILSTNSLLWWPPLYHVPPSERYASLVT
jgi:hypothetical protein